MTRNASAYPRLLADVGGTNVRFALESAPMRIGEVTGYKVADFVRVGSGMTVIFLVVMLTVVNLIF